MAATRHLDHDAPDISFVQKSPISAGPSPKKPRNGATWSGRPASRRNDPRDGGPRTVSIGNSRLPRSN